MIGPAGWGIGLGVMGCLLSSTTEAMSAAVRPKIKLKFFVRPSISASKGLERISGSLSESTEMLLLGRELGQWT